MAIQIFFLFQSKHYVTFTWTYAVLYDHLSLELYYNTAIYWHFTFDSAHVMYLFKLLSLIKQ